MRRPTDHLLQQFEQLEPEILMETRKIHARESQRLLIGRPSGRGHIPANIFVKANDGSGLRIQPVDATVW